MGRRDRGRTEKREGRKKGGEDLLPPYGSSAWHPISPRIPTKAPEKYGWVLSAAFLFSPARRCLLTPQEPAPEVTRGPKIQEAVDRPRPPLSPHTPAPPFLSLSLFHLSRCHPAFLPPLPPPRPISYLRPRSSLAHPQTRPSPPVLCSSDLTHFAAPHPTCCCLTAMALP